MAAARGIARFLVPAFFLAGTLTVIGACRGREGLPPSVMEQVREAQGRWLTVDAYRVLSYGALSSEAEAGRDHTPSDPPPLWPGFRKMREAGLDAVVLMITGSRPSPAPDGGMTAREAALRTIELIREMAADFPGEIGLALTSQDAYRFEKEGKLAVFLGLGDGYALGKDPSLAGFFHSLGVRVMTLCGDLSNGTSEAAADSSAAAGRACPEDPGLGDFDRAVVAECNRLGVVVDASRCSDQALSEVLALSAAPVVVSHSRPSSFLGDQRRLSDAMIRRLAENGGIVVVGLVEEHRAGTGPEAPIRPGAPGLNHALDSIGRISRLAGSDQVAVGSGSGAANINEATWGPDGTTSLTTRLLRRGHAETEMERIWGGNLMRVLDQAKAVAENQRGDREGENQGRSPNRTDPSPRRPFPDSGRWAK